MSQIFLRSQKDAQIKVLSSSKSLRLKKTTKTNHLHCACGDLNLVHWWTNAAIQEPNRSFFEELVLDSQPFTSLDSDTAHHVYLVNLKLKVH